MSKAKETYGESGDDDYLVDHSIIFYFMGPNGKFIEHYGAQLTEVT